MSAAQGSVRQRGGQNPKKRGTTPLPDGTADDEVLTKASQEVKQVTGSDWEYKVTLVVLTILAFATRFYGIRHPNQVVFDEVHFGKV
jgi:dolichyl-phosphate-mannose-protein mannosyltransferase